MQRLDWPFEDPAEAQGTEEEQLQKFRDVRDQIEARILEWLKDQRQPSSDFMNLTTQTLQVFDPAMCCSTGVCGPEVDTKLVQFAADLDWLKSQGVIVQRHNLSQTRQRSSRTKP